MTDWVVTTLRFPDRRTTPMPNIETRRILRLLWRAAIVDDYGRTRHVRYGFTRDEAVDRVLAAEVDEMLS